MDAYKNTVALENKAKAASDERRYDAAILLHGRALARAEGLARPRLTAVLFSRLGETLETAGRIQQAVVAYESALRALAADTGLDIGDALSSLGVVGKEFGMADLLTTMPDLGGVPASDDLDAAQDDPALPVRILIHIGDAYLRQPQESPALNAYQQALKRPEIEQAPELRAQALVRVGIIQRRRGETAAAEQTLAEALALLEAHGDRLEKRRALGILAGIYRDRGQTDRALSTYDQALGLYAEAHDPFGEGRARNGLGRLYLELRQFADARRAFERAVALAKETGDDETLWQAYWGLGRCQREAGDLEGATESFRQSLSLIGARHQELTTDEGKVTFLEGVQGIFDELISVLLQRAETEPESYAAALEVAEEARGRALHDLIGARRHPLTSRLAGREPARTRPFSERQAAAQAAPAFSPMAQMAPSVQVGPPPDWQDLLDSALWAEHAGSAERGPTEAAPGTLVTAAHAPAPAYAGVPQPPPIARLVFHLLPDCTAVFAVTPKGDVHGHAVPTGRDAVAKRVEDLRAAMRVDSNPRGVELVRDAVRPALQEHEEDVHPLLHALYADLIAPVAQWLPTDGTPVVLEPHGALWLLPFAALLDEDDTWLADRWPLLCAPSSDVLDEIRREPDYGSPKDLKALVVGNPIMPDLPPQDGIRAKLESLPGAEREAQTVAALFPEPRRTVLLGEAADWVTVVTLMPQHGIIHLATHGIAVAGDPLASFVVLGAPSADVLQDLRDRSASSRASALLASLADEGGRNGLLTARQVLQLPLPADLVVLSACQTGLGRITGDGMIGLSRSFLVAGARSVLVSGWSVSDEATTELMAAFYRHYIEFDDKALALQLAMRELRSKPACEHPRYWAPFVVVGAEA